MTRPQSARPEAPSPASGPAPTSLPLRGGPSRRRSEGSRREGTSVRCDWAACDKPSVAHEDNYAHCAEHLTQHRVMFGKTVLDPFQTRLIELHSQGRSDVQIAEELGVNSKTVCRHRNELGLPIVGKPGPRELKPCGTQAAYRRHLRRGEPPCFTCSQAEGGRRRINAYPTVVKGQRKAAS